MSAEFFNCIWKTISQSDPDSYYRARIDQSQFSSGHHGLAGWEGQSLGAPAVGSGGEFLWVLAAVLLNSLVFLADLLDACSAGSRDGCNIAVVGVDADKLVNALRLDVLDNDVARATVVAAVSASAVELASSDNRVVLNCDGSTSVVLNDLVLRVLGTASLDKDVTVTESRNRICESMIS